MGASSFYAHRVKVRLLAFAVPMVVIACDGRYGDRGYEGDPVPEQVDSSEPARPAPPSFDSGTFDTLLPEDIEPADTRAPATVSSLKCLWSMQIATHSNPIYSPPEIAVDKTGNVYVAGSYYGPTTFPGGVSSGAKNATYVLKLAADGTPVWTRTLVAKAPPDFPHVDFGGMALDASGVVIAGRTKGTVDPGSGTLSPVTEGAFVAKYDTEGKHLWSLKSKGGGEAYALGVAVDGKGDITVVGTIYGPVDFGLGPLDYQGDFPSTGQPTDGFVLRLDSAGKPLWNKRYGDRTSQVLSSVASAPDDGVVFFGGGNGFSDFGGGALGVGDSSSQYLVRLDAKGGHVFSRLLVSHGYVARAAFTASGDIVVAGSGRHPVALGGPVLKPAGGIDGWIARYDGKGTQLGAALFGGVADDWSGGLAVRGDGVTLVVGTLSDQATIAGSAIVGGGAADALLLEVAADGSVTRAHRFGDHRDQHANSIALAPDGKHFYWLGTFTGSIDLGAGPLAGAKSPTEAPFVFIAKCPL